jgi:hypothetical protein
VEIINPRANQWQKTSQSQLAEKQNGKDPNQAGLLFEVVRMD